MSMICCRLFQVFSTNAKQPTGFYFYQRSSVHLAPMTACPKTNKLEGCVSREAFDSLAERHQLLQFTGRSTRFIVNLPSTEHKLVTNCQRDFYT